MIKPLRKYHFAIWHFQAMVLPLFFILAIIVRPTDPSRKVIRDTAFVGTIESNTDSTYLVTLKVGHYVKAPSCVIILSNPSGERVLGTVDRQGSYSFVTPKVEPPVTLKLWDAIHRKLIDSVHLTQKN